MRAFLQTALLLVLSCIVTPALAEQSPLGGTWYGLIDGYSSSDPRRVLKVTVRDQKFVCTWDEVGKTIDYPAACEVKGNSATLTTGFGSKISLVQDGHSLKGTFVLKSGQSYPIAMGRSEQAMALPERPFTGFASWNVCKAKFSGRTDGGLWMEPHGNKVNIWADFSSEGMKHYLGSQRGGGYKYMGYNSDWVEKGNRVETWSHGGIKFILDFTTPSTFNLSFTTESGWPYKGDGICFR